MPDHQMNPSQRSAVMHGEGPLLVLAGPGSGKTFVITRRIQYLLEEMQVPPERILVITFTKEAALSMERRFQQSTPHSLPVNFGTFHSVFYHILQQSKAIQNNQLLKDSQKRKLIIPILNNLQTENTGQNAVRNVVQSRTNDRMEDAIQVLSAISYYKNTGSMEAAAGKLEGCWRDSFEEILKRYEAARAKAGGIDFDDMVFLCRKLLQEDESMRRYWQGRFDHILMDEFQDINPMQYQVIKLLAPRSSNLFAVGDDDQAIYGFRGSSPGCLKQFAEEYHAQQIYLNVNYRSTPQIVEASRKVIAENRERFVKEIISYVDWGRLERNMDKPTEEQIDGAVSLKTFTEREEQYEYLIQQLAKDTQESRAVLFRTNAFLQGFATRLRNRGIDFEMKEKAASIYEHFICKDMMAYLQLAQGCRERGIFLSIMNKPSRYISREAIPKDEVSFSELKNYYRRKQKEIMPQPGQTQSKWQKQESQRLGQVERQIRILEQQLEAIARLSPYLALRYIYKAVGYERYLRELAAGRKERLQEWMEYLEWLFQDSRQYQEVKQWRQAQIEYGQAMETATTSGNTIVRLNPAAGKQQSRLPIQLMTVHASKGLEFDHVWIPDCNEKIFPHGKMPDTAVCEEERRIFYVAMTRAKHHLELLYITGTTERPRIPSRFLNPFLIQT